MKKSYKVSRRNTTKQKKSDPHSPPLKGFFRAGENYVPLLSKKSKILSRILETDKFQNPDD